MLGAMFALFVAMVLGCDPDACGPPTAGTEVCPVDECAAECWSPALAIGCCLDAHGRGLGPREQAQVDRSTGRLEDPPDTSQFGSPMS